MSGRQDDRAGWASAYQRASRALGVAIGMIAPGLLGVLVDRYVGTLGLFALLGFTVGLTYGIVQLVALGRTVQGDGPLESIDTDSEAGAGADRVKATSDRNNSVGRQPSRDDAGLSPPAANRSDDD